MAIILQRVGMTRAQAALTIAAAPILGTIISVAMAALPGGSL